MMKIDYNILIEINIIFSVLYIIYLLFFKRYTFHKTNRYYLLAIVPISLVIPLLPQLESDVTVLSFIPPLEEFSLVDFQEISIEDTIISNSTLNYETLLVSCYWLGIVVSLCLLIAAFAKIYHLLKAASIEKVGNYKIVHASVNEVFSFFSWIFIPANKTTENTIIEHEKEHVKQLHSYDIVLAEVLKIVFWFNPLIHLYKKSIKSVHEFEVDQHMTTVASSTINYLNILSQTIATDKTHGLYSYFNHSILKKRILMMTKTKTRQSFKLMYLVLIPCLSVLTMAFIAPDKERFLPSTEIIENTVHVNNESDFIFPVKGASMKDIKAKFNVNGKDPISGKPRTHKGIDVVVPLGTPVLATADGVIQKAIYEKNWGNLIVISHNNGYESWYAHLKGFAITDKQTVKKGDVIGYVGSTGRSTGPHLHFEIHKNNVRIDPLKLITE